MFALLTPSLEFIPEFASFVELMQLGLVDDKTRKKKRLKKDTSTRGG